MANDLYEQLAESYDLLISWKSRLKRERPFLTRVFKDFRVRRILDTAAGTGIHAIAFHDWGYHVVGADISEKMVEKARENSAGKHIEFVQAGFTDLDKVDGMFDAVTCLGNSLPHVLTDEELDASLASMFDALLPGGVLIIHGNNYDRVLARQERYMPLASGKREGREYVFMRFFDFHGDTLTFNVVTMSKHKGEWHMLPASSTHRALTHDLLTGHLRRAGFENLQVYGSFAEEPFDRLESDNLIVVAQRPHNAISRPVGEPVSAIDRIPIRENGDPLVDIAVEAPEVGTREECMYARRTTVEMLRKAQSLLPQGHTLLIRGAFRSWERQREMYQGFLKRLKEEHPDWPPSQLRRHANLFLAPVDAKHPPGHSTGGAIDLTVLGPDGEELDFVSTLKPVENHMAVFPTYSKLITPAAAKNRQMLVDIMLAAGFSNYPGEWWHYSYGDSAWAVRVGAPFAPYGAAPAPDCYGTHDS